MENDVVIHGLLRRRSEIAGEILHLDGQVEKLRADLKHLDAALKVMGYVNEDAFPVRKACTSGLFHRKELGRLVVGHLRSSTDGLQARDIALAISRDKGWETDDQRFQKALTDKVSRALSKMKVSGRADYENAQSGCVWRLL
ncbi:hypothetical protein [Nitratireductor pacificus]|uniref:Uncharacterized protein n=1 Tax=Nitratireductor pacificus pht-3B TaxID=391937 RepID=K2LIU7_9HYPH|nr:hypothetical protein [Nitratireductor pacificus]EKF17624.1 hypothetical protein NA2_17067 [Nitratireductor pacificus pht-3B]